MAHTLRTAAVLGLLLSLLGLSACGSATPTSSAPTPDLNSLRTEVASTVLAQVTADLARTPSATLNPTPTVTILATNTLAPTASPGAAGAPGVTSAPQGALEGTPAATVSGTPGTATPSTFDLAAWVSQSIQDNTVMTPGQAFTITWRLKNVGTSTWTTAYRLRFYSGNNFGAPNQILLGRDVPPGDTLDITIPMSAPALVGDYRTDWVLSDETLSNFKQPVFLKISVAIPATATRTATSAPATATP